MNESIEGKRVMIVVHGEFKSVPNNATGTDVALPLRGVAKEVAAIATIIHVHHLFTHRELVQ